MPNSELRGKPTKVVNAWWGHDRMYYLVKDPTSPTGVRQRSLVAEHSTFLPSDNVDAATIRKLRQHPSISKVTEEGDWVRVKFPTRDECWKFCTHIMKADGQTFEGAISPVLRWMVDNDVGVEAPRILFIDLETDSRVPFSRKEEMRILCWSAEDLNGNHYRGMLGEDTDRDERRVLSELWEVVEQYDLVAAWNGDRFDFEVLKARSERRGLMRNRDWRRWLWLDHLIVFQKMNTMAAESGEEKQSYALDAIAHAVLGVGKHNFDASKTWEEWEAGGKRRQVLGDYCAQDTALMPQLEKKTGYIELLRVLGDACGTFADSRGTNPSVQVESYLQRLGAERGHKFPTIRKQKFEKYKGAFVMHPRETGLIRNVHVADFAKLYPSIILSWNMSPDTFVGMDGDPEVEAARAAGVDLSYSPLTGAYFDTRVEGILPAAVAKMIELREYWNNQKKKFAPGTEEWKDADRRSTAYKIAANSFYGVVGAPTSRFFRRPVAEAVSQCGAWLITKTIDSAEAQGMSVVYGDTDSLFVVGATRTEFEEFVARCNAELYPELLAEVGTMKNLIDLDYEKQFDRLVFPKGSNGKPAAKRYIGSYVHYKGALATVDSKPEIKGLEFKRGDSLRFVRQLQEEVVYMLVGYKREPVEDPEVYMDLLNMWRLRIMLDDLALDDVKISKRLSREIKGYARRTKKDGDWARQPPHVEVARILEGRGRDVGEGAKIEYYILNGSVKPAIVAPAEDWDGQVDRATLFTMVSKPSLRLLEAAFPNSDWKPFHTALAKKDRKGKRVAFAGF